MKSLSLALFAVILLLVLATAGNESSNHAVKDLPLGLRPNRPLHAGEQVSVCIYSASRPAGFGEPGGGYFHEIASSTEFTHRINAPTIAAAIQHLEFLREHAWRDGREIVAVSVIDHSAPAQPQLNRQLLTDGFYAELARCRVRELNTLGCQVAETNTGAEYVRRVAAKFGFSIFAATRAHAQFAVLTERVEYPSRSFVSIIRRNAQHIRVDPDGTTHNASGVR